MIIFGLINIALVYLCSCLNIYLISAAMIILIIIGLYGSVDYIKEGKKIAILGIVLNAVAAIIYVWRFIEVLFSLISGIFNF